MTSTKVTLAGLRLFLLVLFFAYDDSVKALDVPVPLDQFCQDSHSECSSRRGQCATSQAIRIVCKKTCKVCTDESELDTSNSPKTYVGFVVDDTGSMGNEIGGVKLWIEACLSGDLAECGEMPTGGWILTSFNDPRLGTVVGPTMDRDDIKRAARNYRAHGGGDCPEMAFGGLEAAGRAVPDYNAGCKIFFITDATAKDHAKSSSVMELYDKKGCTFTCVLTGCCGDCPSPEDAVGSEYASTHAADSRKRDRLAKRSTADDIKSLFYKVSKKTGGNIYVMDKPTSAKAMLNFLKEVTLGFCPTNDLAGPRSGGYKCEEDCKAMKMCWDKSVSKCYCTGKIPCARSPIKPSNSRCPGWASWSRWSACSRLCGSGTRRRKRSCSVEGKCSNLLSEKEQTEKCNVQKCPEWNNWSNWGTCSRISKRRARVRTCSVPKKCIGDREQTKACIFESWICPECPRVAESREMLEENWHEREMQRMEIPRDVCDCREVLM